MSNQIQNLKSPIIKKKIKNFAILFFSLFLILVVFSQVAAKATSHVAFGSGKLQPSDWLYYKSNNDLTAYLGKKSSTLPTVRYQKGGDYLEFSMNQAVINDQTTDISTTTAVSLETNTKQPNTPTLFYRNILNDIDANYQITKIPFKIKEEIILKSQISNLKSKNLTFLFSAETSATPTKQQDGSIIFTDNQNNYLFQIDKPFMIDNNGNRSEDVTI
ncbi:MAG: hypothetical protein AAB781_01465, partial [Patescibacteria group bacterium]